MASKAKRRETGDREQFWRRLIREQRRGGSSIKAFCRDRGVSEPSFFAWRKRLAAAADGDRSDFVAVRVAPADAAGSSAIEIMLDGRRRVRVEAGFDRQALRDVLAVLERGSC